MPIKHSNLIISQIGPLSISYITLHNTSFTVVLENSRQFYRQKIKTGDYMVTEIKDYVKEL